MSRGNRPRVRSSRERERVATAKSYPRTARLNESLREVIAEELESIDDERLPMVTVTGIETDADMRQAVVFFSSLLGGQLGGEADLAGVEAVLATHRIRLQAAVGRELRLKRTPTLTFVADSGVLEGARIESILKDLPRPDDGDSALPTMPVADPNA